MRYREMGFLIDCLYPHLLHERANMASANLVALVPEFVPDATAALERVLQVHLVHEAHKYPFKSQLVKD
jgi:hypothetical protein